MQELWAVPVQLAGRIVKDRRCDCSGNRLIVADGLRRRCAQNRILATGSSGAGAALLIQVAVGANRHKRFAC